MNFRLVSVFCLSVACFVTDFSAYAGGRSKKAVTPYVNLEPAPGLLGKVSSAISVARGLTGRSTIQPCCTAISTGQVNVNTAYHLEKGSYLWDPYTTGPIDFPRRAITVDQGVDYVYQAPVTLGSPDQIPNPMSYNLSRYKTSSNGITESDKAYNYRRLAEVLTPSPGLDLSAITTEVGSGAMSHVFMIHDPIPSDAELSAEISEEMATKRYPEAMGVEHARRLLWATLNSKEVIKVRTPNPWGEGLDEAANGARRDIALTQVFDECAKNFYEIENGQKKPLIEIVHYNNAHHELQTGFFRQPTVNGESAYMIAVRVAQAREGDKTANQYLVDQMNFKSWEEAERKIRLLEAFFVETHYDIIQFEKVNSIPMMASPARASAHMSINLLTVGFDYHQGINVMWNPQARVFKAIDL